MDAEAKTLAQKMLNSGKRDYYQTYTVGNDPDDIIIISVKRTTKKVEKSIKRFSEVVAGPIGQVCGCCNGTGRS